MLMAVEVETTHGGGNALWWLVVRSKLTVVGGRGGGELGKK